MAADDQRVWWVLRAQTGDREALEWLLADLQLPLFRFLLRLAGPDRAPDLLQETLICICRGLPRLSTPEVVLSWAFRIAAREAFRRIKADASVIALSVDGGQLAALPAEEARGEGLFEWTDRLPALLMEVPAASRAVLILHHLQEMSLREVADVLDIGLGTVKSRLSYGHKVLGRLASLRGFP